MPELRLRGDKGRFASVEEESSYMNSMLQSLAGGGAPPTPEPKPTASAGQPVPPTPDAALPAESENVAMNAALREMCGIYSDSR